MKKTKKTKSLPAPPFFSSPPFHFCLLGFLFPFFKRDKGLGNKIEIKIKLGKNKHPALKDTKVQSKHNGQYRRKHR